MDILPGLIDSVRTACSGFYDKRSGSKNNATYSMADVGMAAFSLFFTQSESFLAHQRSLQEEAQRSNCQSLFEMDKIPTDSHIRQMLDEVEPTDLQPCFDTVVETLRTKGGLKEFKTLGDRILIALDGTEYFRSKKLSCDFCLHRKLKDGTVDNYHSMLAATIVSPGHNIAVPLMPEFIAPQDGAKKQDCERNAAKRWLNTHGGNLKELNPVYLGDALFACQPMAKQIIDNGDDFIFVCKPDDNSAIFDHVETQDKQTFTRKVKGITYDYRWCDAVPMRKDDPIFVNWIELTITNANGVVTYKNSFVTSLDIEVNNAVDIVAAGRARWKIENEGFNVLKNHGYNIEHNFGHGKESLSMVFAALNLLAFGFHALCDELEELWQKARAKRGSRKRFFEHLKTITAYLIFPTWQSLMQTLATGKPPPECFPATTPGIT